MKISEALDGLKENPAQIAVTRFHYVPYRCAVCKKYHAGRPARLLRLFNIIEKELHG